MYISESAWNIRNTNLLESHVKERSYLYFKHLHVHDKILSSKAVQIFTCMHMLCKKRFNHKITQKL